MELIGDDSIWIRCSKCRCQDNCRRYESTNDNTGRHVVRWYCVRCMPRMGWRRPEPMLAPNDDSSFSWHDPLRGAPHPSFHRNGPSIPPVSPASSPSLGSNGDSHMGGGSQGQGGGTSPLPVTGLSRYTLRKPPQRLAVTPCGGYLGEDDVQEPDWRRGTVGDLNEASAVEFQPRVARSWFAAEYSRCLGAKLADRLVERCHGERGRFLTLTYRRDEYESPHDLYETAKRDRHMRRFIARLAAMLGPLCGQRDAKGRWSLTGKWFRKMEFQQGGWIHWHLVILVPWIENREHELTNCWGHGYAYIQPLEENTLRYAAKYISKDGGVPSWVLSEAQRSVKIIASSPGFWRNDPVERPSPPEPWGTKVCDAFIPIGEALERSESRILLRDPDGNHGQIKMSHYDFVRELSARGFSMSAGESASWLRVEGISLRQVIEWADRRASREAADRPLHLIKNTIPPDGGGSYINNVHRKWLKIVIGADLGWRQDVTDLGTVGGLSVRG